MKRIYRHLAKPFAALLMLLVTVLVNGQSRVTLDAGSAALNNGDYKGAEAFYRKALAASPKSPEILSNFGIALQMQGKSSEAIHAFEQALQQKQMPRTYALLAKEKCETRDLDGARPMLARITHEYFQDPSILAVIAPCYLELNDPIDSVRVYESLLSYRAYPPDLALIQLAKSYLKAAQFFFGRLSRAPGSAVYVSAIREARDKRSPNARGAFDIAAKASPYFQPSLDFSGAVARWREHPQDAALLYLLNVLSGEQSMRQVEICDEKYPDSPYLVQLKAEILADQDHDDEAIALYESLIQTHPEFPNPLYDLGMLFRKEKKWEKALDAFQRQLEKHPDDERSTARISEALIRLGRWKEVSDFLSTRVGTADPPLWAVLDFAEASQNMDHSERAITVLATAEQSYPSEKEIHWRLMRLYRLTGNAAQAKKELKLFLASSK